MCFVSIIFYLRVVFWGTCDCSGFVWGSTCCLRLIALAGCGGGLCVGCFGAPVFGFRSVRVVGLRSRAWGCFVLVVFWVIV